MLAVLLRLHANDHLAALRELVGVAERDRLGEWLDVRLGRVEPVANAREVILERPPRTPQVLEVDVQDVEVVHVPRIGLGTEDFLRVMVHAVQVADPRDLHELATGLVSARPEAVPVVMSGLRPACESSARSTWAYVWSSSRLRNVSFASLCGLLG